ncbi:MAG: hypothetical protein RIB60_02955 [Phycisphaerales bacterium]
MRRLMDMLGDLITGDPRVAIGLGVVIALVIAAVIYARVTRAKRLKAQAKFVRKRD